MPNPMFKVGDHIKCVDPNTHTQKVGAPVLNGTYTVSEIHEQYEDRQLIKVLGCDVAFWSHRFELVKWVPKVGDVVTVNIGSKYDWPYAHGQFTKTYVLGKQYPNIDGGMKNPNTGELESLWRIPDDDGDEQWIASHQLINAANGANTVSAPIPQRKKRIYNAISS